MALPLSVVALSAVTPPAPVSAFVTSGLQSGVSAPPSVSGRHRLAGAVPLWLRFGPGPWPQSSFQPLDSSCAPTSGMRAALRTSPSRTLWLPLASSADSGSCRGPSSGLCPGPGPSGLPPVAVASMSLYRPLGVLLVPCFLQPAAVRSAFLGWPGSASNRLAFTSVTRSSVLTFHLPSSLASVDP